jgi:hypothetical protein
MFNPLLTKLQKGSTNCSCLIHLKNPYSLLQILTTTSLLKSNSSLSSVMLLPHKILPNLNSYNCPGFHPPILYLSHLPVCSPLPIFPSPLFLHLSNIVITQYSNWVFSYLALSHLPFQVSLLPPNSALPFVPTWHPRGALRAPRLSS